MIDETENTYDAVLVGAGVMSSTLAMLLHEIEPEIRVLILERLDLPAMESSAASNNAGTGHAANCELNYTPLRPDGTVEISKALSINFAFEQSLEFWAYLAAAGKIDPSQFMNVLPHISFVSGSSDSEYLNQRFDRLRKHPAFVDMELSRDFDEIKDWMPLVMEGRTRAVPVASTRIKRGLDIDFGGLTSSYLDHLQKVNAIDMKLSCEVIDLRRVSAGLWEIDVQTKSDSFNVRTPFIFLGAGGGSLSLLQKSRISEGLNYGGFPVSGQWLICSNKSLIDRHNVKVYGKAKVGAPPMSVPHLDSRWIGGKRSLLFGPFAGFSTKFLKQGSRWDLFRSIGVENFTPMLQVGLNNSELVKYLVSQIMLKEADRLNELRNFLPNAEGKDWQLAIAGQRVQVIKRSSRGGVLQMGTEVVTASDGSLAALLGASPGASTAVAIMLEVLQRCGGKPFHQIEWQRRLKHILPSSGKDFHVDASFYKKMRSRNDSLLNLV